PDSAGPHGVAVDRGRAHRSAADGLVRHSVFAGVAGGALLQEGQHTSEDGTLYRAEIHAGGRVPDDAGRHRLAVARHRDGVSEEAGAHSAGPGGKVSVLTAASVLILTEQPDGSWRADAIADVPVVAPVLIVLAAGSKEMFPQVEDL